LPDEILSRRKMGFPVPVGAWLRGEWRPIVDELVLGTRAQARGLFDVSAVRGLVAEHQSGINHSERLWGLITFETWARVFLDGEAPGEMQMPQAEAA
jgi:asparagine synthase (glutamine-hydrolysing)